MRFFELANFIEAGLWILIGSGFVVRAILPRTPQRTTTIVAAATLIAFGFSDVVETRTGAWWRPWWLLVWKGVCVSILVTLLARYVKRRGRRVATPNTSPPSSATASGRPAGA